MVGPFLLAGCEVCRIPVSACSSFACRQRAVNRLCNGADAGAMIAEMARGINRQDIQLPKHTAALTGDVALADEGRSGGQASRGARQRTRKVVPCSGVLVKDAVADYLGVHSPIVHAPAVIVEAGCRRYSATASRRFCLHPEAVVRPDQIRAAIERTAVDLSGFVLLAAHWGADDQRSVDWRLTVAGRRCRVR